ncbi:cytochrome P450 4V2-like, partial [Oppia nitens]|uniref:cytochrome P450 4V2-like n=1 Tax=Oppia nitens TaxID=1686743 RepID=UPI0023DC37E9
CLARIPGPRPRYPLIGNLDMFRIPGVSQTESTYRILVSLCKLYNNYGIYKILLGQKPIPILSSNINIEKSYIYKFLSDWLGDGLVLSTGSKWKGRRKLLTPAFHFRKLDDYLPVMNKQTNIFLDIIRNKQIDGQQQQQQQQQQSYIDIREPVVQLVLDIICETAMGVQVGAQLGQNQSYVSDIHYMGKVFMKRIFMPWIWSDRIFYWTSIGRKFRKSLDSFHLFTRNVINEKIRQFKKGMAFLDLLLDYYIKDNNNNTDTDNDNKLSSLEDIREEVDTFMFNGHESTSTSIGWSLYLIGLHPNVQQKIGNELTRIFGRRESDINRDISLDDIQQLTYLKCVIEESLRLYPSAPFIARRLVEDCPVGIDDDTGANGYVIPAGVDVFLMIAEMHLDSLVFADPNRFRPERFESDSVTMSQINAYNYVPFSAGPRGCIGKRFALIEQMIILAKICQNFTIESMKPLDSIQTSAEMAYRAKK